MAKLTLSAKTVRMILNEDIDIYDVLTDRESRMCDGEDVLIQEMYNEVALYNGLDPDDDLEEIIDLMLERIEANHG